MNIKDLINGGEGFKNFADFIILSDKEPFNTNILKQNAIIFCKTDFINFLFSNIKYSGRKYILITHHSDYYIDKQKFQSKPNCIKKWYAWTAAYEHEDLIPIPIGFATMFNPYPIADDDQQKWFLDNLEELRSIEKDYKTVYCNFTIDNLRPPRQQIVNKMLTNNINCYTPPNNHTVHGRLTFPDYCKDAARFKFIASPRGNGGDSTRTWDAIYMNSIPIVIKDLVYRDFNLPILQVNDYSEVTNKLLSDYLKYYNNHDFNYEKSTLSYWKNRMKEDLRSN